MLEHRHSSQGMRIYFSAIFTRLSKSVFGLLYLADSSTAISQSCGRIIGITELHMYNR